MSGMRKFGNVSVWGHVAPTKVHSVSLTTPSVTVCKHAFGGVFHPRESLSKGMFTFSLVPNLRDVVARLEPDGLRADWLKVGHDMRCGIQDVASKLEPISSVDGRDAA